MAVETRERELKLVPPDEWAWPPDLPGETLPDRTFTSIYFDTPLRTLARSGLTLRRRVEGDDGRWQLKLPAGSARREIELEGGPLPPAEVRSLLRAHRALGELEPVAELVTHRTGVRVLDGDRTLADAVLDEVEALDRNGDASRFRELEVELVDGDEDDLGVLGRKLRKAGASLSDGRPKVFRLLGLETQRPPRRRAGTVVHVRAAIGRQLSALLRHDVGLRLRDDVEELHDFRVATRRLRAILRASRDVLGREQAEQLRDELSWLASGLGPARDLDVMLEQLKRDRESLAVPERRASRSLVGVFERARRKARDGVVTALDDQRYLALVQALHAAAVDDAPAAEEVSLAELARADFRRLRKAVSALEPSAPDDALHAVRIRAKRARYTAELAAPVEGVDAEAFVSKVTALQDVIGEHQDAVVLEERIRSAVVGRRAPAVLIAAGALVERQRARRARAREDLPAAWAKARRAGKKAWE
jgi:CHAD domain-containing protein